jgi:hypothetical protein
MTRERDVRKSKVDEFSVYTFWERKIACKGNKTLFYYSASIRKMFILQALAGYEKK